LRDRLGAFARVCDAVHFAHQRGVIHRDLKPSNILVEAGGRPRILDFGLARMIDESDGARLTRTTGFFGTPAYAPPEQIAGKADDVDVRSDVYALGVVLYELVCGSLPFESEKGLGELFDAVRSRDPQRLSARTDDAGTELDAIALKAMAKDPSQRYQSVDALGQDVRRLLAGETVLAHPPGAMYHLRTYVRRHKGTSATIGGAFVLVTLLALAAGLLAARLVREQAALRASLIREQQATAQAEEQEAHAQAALEKSESSATFLGRMLADVGRQRPDPDVPVRDLLAQAAARLDRGEIRDQPEVEFRLRRALMDGYKRLALHDLAESQARAALRTAREHFGERSLEVASMCNHLGRIHEEQGRLADGETMLRTAVEIATEFGGEARAAGMMSNLASVLDSKGDYKGAEALYRHALALTPDPPAVNEGTLRRNIGLELLEQGKLPEAEADTTRAVMLLAEPRNDTDADRLLRAERNLARIRHAQGRTPEALELMQGVLVRWTAIVGEDHPQIWFERTHCASMLADLGRHEEARAMLGKCIELLTAWHGASHYRVTMSRLVMARVLSEAGENDAARAILEEALRDARIAPEGCEFYVSLVERALQELTPGDR
jgi:tetratricopeptide (TPR) repeat protein